MKKLPSRTCIGCNTQKLKKEFIRVVRNQAGEIQIDRTGKLPGRGAYLCNNTECLAKAIRSKRLEKCFKTSITQTIYEELQKEIEKQEV